MASNLSVQIGADTSGLSKSLKDAKSVLQDYKKAAKSASDEIKENASVSEAQVTAYNRVVKSLEKVESGSMSTSQAQKALATQLKELKVQWANLSDTAKSGAFGASMSQAMSAVETELNTLTSQMKQVDSEMGKFGASAANTPAKKEFKELTFQLTELTKQYRAMSAQEQQSAAGRELASKMDEIREKAGTLKDTIGDVNQEITALASDTPNLDVFNEAIGIGADALSAYASIIAKVTGDEKSLQQAISTVMAVQSAANLMTKVTNALQSSSVIMLKTRAIQEKAAATAIAIKTAAENKGKVATIAATAAQKAFNLVAYANPYVLLAMAIVGVGAALVAFTRHQNEATKAQEAANKKAEEAKKKQEELRRKEEELSVTTGETTAKFYQLQAQWEQLKTAAQKKQWIDDNQSAFNSLGIAIYDVKTAEDVFVNNTDAVVDALIARAVAAKKAEQAAEDLIALEKKRGQKSVSSGDYYVKANDDNITAEERKKANIPEYETVSNGYGGYYTRKHKMDAAERAKVDKMRAQEAAKRKQQLEQQYDEEEQTIKDGIKQSVKAQGEAEAALAKLGNTPKKKGSNSPKTTPKSTTKEEPVSGSLGDLEKQLSDLKSKYKNGLINVTPEDYKQQVEQLEKAITDKKYELGIEIPIPEGSIADIEKKISKLQGEVKLATDDESRQRIEDEIATLTGQKKLLELKMKPVVSQTDLAKMEQDINAMNERIAKRQQELASKTYTGPSATPSEHKAEKAVDDTDLLEERLELNKQILASYEEQYRLLKEKVAAGAQLSGEEQKVYDTCSRLTSQVQDLSDAYADAAKNAEKLSKEAQIKKKTYEGTKKLIGSLGDVNGAITGTVSTWQNLAENWEDMSPFEKVTSAIDATISTIESVIGAYESISETIQMFQEISALASSKKIAQNTAEMTSESTKTALDTANTQTEIANNTAKQTSDMATMATDTGLAITEATASGAAMPFPANIAAIAAGVAAVVAALAMVASFADGGIVSGSSHVGDNNLARVNAGEMILNGSQQARLFQVLNGAAPTFGNNGTNGGKVDFKIKGTVLRGVLRNTNKKISKI